MSPPEAEGRWLRPFLLAAAFLTRLPAPLVIPRGRELGEATAFYPLIGLALGGALAGVGALAGGALEPALLAGVLVALLAGVTGGLHLDGVADCFDALGVLGDRERRLSVMKDPRVGALGAAALMLVLIVKVLALAEAGWLLLPAGLALSRWLAVVLAVTFPYARPSGTGSGVSAQAGWRELLLGGVLVVVAVAASGPAAWLGALGAIVGVWLLARKMHTVLGGLTGDVYGAAVEIAELSFFLAAALIR